MNQFKEQKRMIKVVQRLEFKNVFPEEEKKEVFEYLSKVPKEILLKSIGYFNTHPLPNFDRFFSNKEVQKEIYDRVVHYSKENDVKKKPELISRQGCLKLTELILSNRESLIDGNTNESIDEGEKNLFKAILVANEDLNKNQSLENLSENNHEKLVDCCIIFTFPVSDLAIFEDNGPEFLKLIYTTIVKVEYLFEFLNSKPEYSEMRDQLISSFNTESQDDFIKEMKYLFGKQMELVTKNGYIFEVENEQSEAFLNSMVSDDIGTDEDFTFLKIHPIYKLGDHKYSIINHFYVVDKFYRSAKFKLKEVFEADEKLKADYGDFFNFFNKEYSENYLMKNILDDLYRKPYFVKKIENAKELAGEPDYYIRHGNCVFIFENKDVLIAKAIKASSDIEKINNALKQKFLGNENHTVGIGQLINTIEEILSKKFRFDNYVNTKNNLKIYPILLVHDRIFQTLGINYRMNNWYIESVRKRLGNNYHPSNIKGLTVIDIDTLILWIPYLRVKDNNFRNIIDDHLSKMNKKWLFRSDGGSSSLLVRPIR